MVDPVNNRGYYEYRRVDTKTGTGMGNGEKFSLEQGHAEKESEKKEEKTKVEADGVIAEFSSQSQGQYGGVGSRQKTQSDKNESVDLGQTVERVRGFIGDLVKAIAGFFGSIRNSLLDFWNSDSPGAAAGDGDAAKEEELAIDVTEMSQSLEGGTGLDVVEAEGVVERAIDTKPAKMESRRAEAEQYLKNSAQMERYVKNSDLLTYYDRSGRIVQMNGADKSRILHGDTRTSRGV